MEERGDNDLFSHISAINIAIGLRAIWATTFGIPIEGNDLNVTAVIVRDLPNAS